MHNSKLEPLVVAAKLLTLLHGELVFVSWCAIGLFISDEGVSSVRPIFDVNRVTISSSTGQSAQ